ncbi:dynein heavy chain, putative [Leishmania donovani]|uniref:Dynein heavy chain, putative n=1 Tax=Leishmania donovani TaxID=5661 RepID=A0A3S5H6S6_LEIDO|nr:dynein heavy chain, putative [Leishmania donovani]
MMSTKIIQELKELPLNTVEDAQKFFSIVADVKAQGIALPPITHMFFARVDAGLHFEPYHIRTICRDNRPMNYYVVTKDHVIHVNRRDGEYNVVATLEQWLLEAKCFNRICKFAFFRNYILHKALLRLLESARRTKLERIRAVLSKRLLLATPTFQKDLIALRRKAFDFQWTPVTEGFQTVLSLQISGDKGNAAGLSTDEFAEMQDDYGKSLQRKFASLLLDILSVVSERVESVTQLVSTMRVIEKYPGATGCVNKDVTAKELFKRQREQKRLVVDYEKLPSYIRLVHHFQLESTFQQACSTFFDLEGAVRRRAAILRWRFRVECIVEGRKELSLFPPKEHVTKTAEAAMNKCIDLLSGLPTCVGSEALKPFTTMMKTATVRSALLGDALISIYKKGVLQLIEADYDEAKSKLSSYEPLVAVSQFLAEWQDVSMNWDSTLSHEDSLLVSITESEIRGYATRAYKAQSEIMKLSNRTYGTIVVECDKTLQKLVAQLKGVLVDIEAALGQLIKLNFRYLKAECDSWVGKLSLPDITLGQFINWYLGLQDSGSIFDEFSNNVVDIQNLHRLLCELREKSNAGVISDEVDYSSVLRVPFQCAVTEARKYYLSNSSRIKEMLLAEHTRIIACATSTTKRLASECSNEKANEIGAPVTQKLEDVRDELVQANSEAKQLDMYARVLEMPTFNWSEIAVAEDEHRKYVELWNVHKEVTDLRRRLDTKTVEEIDGQELKDTIVSLFQRAFKAQKSTPGGTADYLVKSLAVEKANVPMYVELCNPALKEAHWLQLFQNTSIQPIPSAKRTLRSLEAAGLMADEHSAAVREVVSSAVGIYELEQQLKKLQNYWANHLFVVVPYGGRSNAFVVDAVDATLEELEEQQIVVQTCLTSKYLAPVLTEMKEWEAKLSLIHSVLMEWVGVQKTWMYLEFIFTSDDIKRQLPDESLLFSSADRFFGSLMKRCYEDPHMAPLCLEGNGDTLKKLQKCTYQLECIQKKIDEYLETKRVAFPRFYFLSNDELLSILSDSRNPLAVQPHLQKCFDNIKALVFADEKTIVAMRSSEGEEVPFTHPVKVIGNVESWLNDVERAMRATLFDCLAACLRGYTTEHRTKWFFEHPAQCVATVDQIMWTSEVEEVITATGSGDSSAWPSYQDRFGEQLLQTVELVKLSLTALQRTVVSNLIVVDVHCRDVCADLAADSPSAAPHPCSSVLDFGWQKQLRFYYGLPTSVHGPGGAAEMADCFVRHGAAELPYGYEYLGNQPRLVITPLTERAFLTCTAALHMQKGAAPQGPAGTGKTESVKDLGKALARTVVVFNCSDGLDYRMMSQMFAGLAQAGAWACFDEFNRIELEVLSVVAQQMLDITTAITQRQTFMKFEGHHIKLHTNFGVFITMNPGYAGRTELPDNLKALFRPVCMMIPNYALIAEIMFYAEGYGKAQSLAAKMIRLYSLASQQLSKQDHYDFGMRAVKSILVLAGRLKRADPDSDEELLLVRAIREANLPKFLVDDRHLFMALLHDFFPTIVEVAPASVSEVILSEAKRFLTEELVHTSPSSPEAQMRLQPTKGLLFKTQQLFDTLMTRHGLMLVGHTMTGKTTVRDTLASVLTRLGRVLDMTPAPGAEGGDSGNGNPGAKGGLAATRRHTLAASMRALDARCQSYFTATHATVCNPKAISMTELYGDVNPLTREWQDGVFSAMVRELVKQSAAQHGRAATRHWVIFDGPVDAVWVENLNTVLDDSKMLCLVNGERIRIPDTISLLFEVQDLRVASPATVSRCGMVYVDEECVDGGWSPLLQSLSQAAAQELRAQWRHDRFLQLCGSLVPPLLQVVREECKEYIGTCNAQLTLNLFYLMKAAVQHLQGVMEEDRQEQQKQLHDDAAAFVLDSGASRQSTDSTLRRFSRRRSSRVTRTAVLVRGDAVFDALFLQSCAWGLGGNLTETTRARFAAAMLPLVRKGALNFPADAEAEGCGVFDYGVDYEIGDWRRWSEMVPEFHYNASVSYFDLLVPTEQTAALQYLLRSATTTHHHMLLNGLTGTGKSSTVNSYLLQTLHTEDAASSTAAFRFTLSAQTSAQALQNTIEMKLTRRKGDREFGAPSGKTMMIAVIDDCNVPQLEEYGAAPPVELLRQMITQGGFYDRKRLFFKEVVQTMLIACCGEPGGGKNEMTPRFTSKLLCFCAPQLTETSMRSIFSAILKGFFYARGFATEVAALADAVVDSTLEAYRRIAVECLPTPDKTHCTFNLRDVSKVFQGILQVKPAHCASPQALIDLWSHEASRVFHDRLIDDTDRGWWWRCCAEVIEKHFCGDVTAANADAADTDGTQPVPSPLPAPDPVQLGTIFYGAWVNRDYQRIGQDTSLQVVAQQHLAEYNTQSTTPMNLVFFDQAVQHLSRICRIVSQPRGHALLVGVGGSGRSSLCRLAAFMMNMDVQTVHIARNYGIEEFRDEVRKVLLDSGARGKEVVFVISDSQLVHSEMLEDINNLLNTGEVPGMMGLEDMETIVRCCREASLASGRPDTRASVYEYFVSQSRERFHLCLCMSPMSGVFRDRLRMFPALVNCTTIDWFSEWPQEALRAVAKSTLSSAARDGAAGPGTDQLSALMVFLQSTVKDAAERLYAQHRRRTHVTPTSYLAVLTLYNTMGRRLRRDLQASANRYRNGLKKLDTAKSTIAQLQQQIREMQPGLAAAAKQVEEQKQTLAVEQLEANQMKEAQSKEEATALQLMNEAESIRRECEEGLQQALPALEAAKQALETLSAKDIQEIKTFTTPPSNVEKTMNAVLVLLGEKDGWASAKTCLGKLDFISRLTGYPRDSITAACIRKLAVFVQDPDFVPDIIEKTSLPCRSMCMWVHAMYKYYFVAKEIAPKRARLAGAEKKVEVARKELQAKQVALQKVLNHISDLQAAAAAAQEKADHFQRQIETAMARLVRADQLISGLASERVRWKEALAKLETQLGCVEGTAALAAGCVGYLGPFPLDYREVLVEQWRSECAALHIPFDATYSLEGIETEATVQQWALQSLPRDTYSIQNATILYRTTQCCYMIDPQGQANAFVRKLERSRSSGAAGLLQLKLNSPNFMRQIENAVQKGQAVLLEDVGETLDAALDPILLKQVHRVAGRDVITLGDREVTYDDRFHLYITTKLANPVLTPELQVKLTVIDFTVTREGLEEQLLADIVGSERASLQQRGDRCVISIAANREEIAALEAQVLQQLSDATGDVLDNAELIQALQTSKVTSEKIAVELAAVEETNKTINATRDVYRPLAVRGSLLYGAITQMSKVDPMYDYSLPFFKNLVVSVLASTRRQRPQLQQPHRSSSISASSMMLGNGSLNGRGAQNCHLSLAPTDSNHGLPGADAEEEEEAAAAMSEAEVEARVVMLVEEVTWMSYRVLCRGLFGPHKLLFSFVLATTLLRSTGQITKEEWELFLCGGAGRALLPAFAAAGGEGSDGATVQRPGYMSSGTWIDFGAICGLEAFAEVCESFIASLADASDFGDADLSGDGPLPWTTWFTETYGAEVLTRLPASLAHLSLWHRVMAVKILRPNKFHYMAAQLVADTLGQRYTIAPPLDLEEAFLESTKMTPIIFILSPGADPTSLFLSFAEEHGFAGRKHMLSLGQDQDVRATQMIREGQREGAWVYLQNCHVYASWMPQLQVLVESMNPSEIHADFRLWLTSNPSPSFPPLVLQAGLKLTQEPPMGLRGKVLSTLRSTVVADVWAATASAADVGNADSNDASVSASSPAVLRSGHPSIELQRLVWTLAFYHGTVMERRRYRPLGWNNSYDWGMADFEAGLATLQTALDRCKDGGAGLPTEELCYMLGTLDFGGRVTDEWDTLCLQVLTRRFFDADAPGTTSQKKLPQDTITPPPFPKDGVSYAALLQLAEATFTAGRESRKDGDGEDENGESPARFGLHDNATLSVEQQLSLGLVDALVLMNASGAVTGATSARRRSASGDHGEDDAKASGDEVMENPVAAVARKLLAQLPPLLPRKEAVLGSMTSPNHSTTTTTALTAVVDPAPLQTLLSHETDLYNCLLSTMQSSLAELIRALKGEVVVTSRLELMMQRLAFNQVPEVWAQVGYLTLKPLGSFMEDLLRRVHFMRRWGEAGPPPSFWLSGVFFPQGFVTALLQARSRALQVPIDSLQLRFRALAPSEAAEVSALTASYEAGTGSKAPTKAGAYVSGLYLEGCGWDAARGGLVEAAPGALTVELPIIHFEPVMGLESAAKGPSASAAEAAAAYVCPLYKVRTRAGTLSTTGVSTNYVTSLTLPSLDGIPGDHWTLRGVAALCALDD